VSQPAIVRSVHASAGHDFSKHEADKIQLIAGIGVAGDAHAGSTVQHRYRVKVDSTQPNLRQVHLIHEELFAELAAKGFRVTPGDLGENITTAGIDLLGLPVGTMLRIGTSALLAVTGLWNIRVSGRPPLLSTPASLQSAGSSSISSGSTRPPAIDCLPKQ
jgi:hypothetical protein